MVIVTYMCQDCIGHMANLGFGRMSNLGLVHQGNEFGELMSIFWYQEWATRLIQSASKNPAERMGFDSQRSADETRWKREKQMEKCPELGQISGFDRRRYRARCSPAQQSCAPLGGHCAPGADIVTLRDMPDQVPVESAGVRCFLDAQAGRIVIIEPFETPNSE